MFEADDGGEAPLLDADTREDVDLLGLLLLLLVLLAKLLPATMPRKLERVDRRK